MEQGIRILLIMPGERPALREALKAGGLEFRAASNCLEARRALAELSEVDVVITAMSLEDGNWVTILDHLVESASRAELIVSIARESDADPLLARGIFDVLSPPYDVEQVRSAVLAAAARSRSTAPSV